MTDAAVIAAFYRWSPSEMAALRVKERQYWAENAARYLGLDVEVMDYRTGEEG